LTFNFFWRVKPQGIHPPLNRLIYINKEEFKLLRSLRLCFLKRIKGFFKKEPISRFVDKKVCIKSSITKDPGQKNGRVYPGYESTKIQYTRASLLWGWIRVREYYKGLEENSPNREIMKEVYELRYS